MRDYLLFTVLQRCIAVHIASSLPSLFLFWGVFSFLHFCDPFLLLCIHNLSSFSQTSFHLCSLPIRPALSSLWPRRASQSAVQLPCFILYFLPFPSLLRSDRFPSPSHFIHFQFRFSFHFVQIHIWMFYGFSAKLRDENDMIKRRKEAEHSILGEGWSIFGIRRFSDWKFFFVIIRFYFVLLILSWSFGHYHHEVLQRFSY